MDLFSPKKGKPKPKSKVLPVAAPRYNYFKANDPRNAAAAARRAATLSSMPNPNIAVHGPGAALGGAGGVGGRINNKAQVPRPRIKIPNNYGLLSPEHSRGGAGLVRRHSDAGAAMPALEENRGAAANAPVPNANGFVNVNFIGGSRHRRRGTRRGCHTRRR